MSNFQFTNTKKQGGYIALISMLIVAAVSLTISMAVSLRGIEELQMSFASSQGARASNLADTCLEEGLNRLRQTWADYTINLSIGDNSCIITVDETGTEASLEAYGIVDNFTKKAYAEVDNNLEITLWQNY